MAPCGDTNEERKESSKIERQISGMQVQKIGWPESAISTTVNASPQVCLVCGLGAWGNWGCSTCWWSLGCETCRYNTCIYIHKIGTRNYLLSMTMAGKLRHDIVGNNFHSIPVSKFTQIDQCSPRQRNLRALVPDCASFLFSSTIRIGRRLSFTHIATLRSGQR
jgi:hypothetical protein